MCWLSCDFVRAIPLEHRARITKRVALFSLFLHVVPHLLHGMSLIHDIRGENVGKDAASKVNIIAGRARRYVDRLRLFELRH